MCVDALHGLAPALDLIGTTATAAGMCKVDASTASRQQV